MLCCSWIEPNGPPAAFAPVLFRSTAFSLPPSAERASSSFHLTLFFLAGLAEEEEAAAIDDEGAAPLRDRSNVEDMVCVC